MPSTLVHGLLPPSCLMMLNSWLPRLNRQQMFRLFVLAVILANAPDIDLIPAALMPQHWKLIHRQWGHNIFSVTLWTTFGVVALRTWVSTELKGKTAWAIAIPLLLSHLILDAMGEPDQLGQRPGVPLFWPFSQHQYDLPIRLFKSYQLDPHLNPILGHLVSRVFWTQVVIHELLCIVTLSAIWAGLVFAVKAAEKIWRRSSKVPAVTSGASAEVERDLAGV